MLGQLEHISNAFDDMIEESKHNQSQIAQRKKKLTQYDQTQIISQSLLQPRTTNC